MLHRRSSLPRHKVNVQIIGDLATWLHLAMLDIVSVWVDTHSFDDIHFLLTGHVLLTGQEKLHQTFIQNKYA